MIVGYAKLSMVLSKSLMLGTKLIQFDFHTSKLDFSLFIYSYHNITIYFFVYVNDLIITSKDNNFISQFIVWLSNEFLTKDFGHLYIF